MKQKFRNAYEWCDVVLRHVTNEEITETDRRYAVQLLENCQSVVDKLQHKENKTDKEEMWCQLNKYFVYLKTLKKE